MPSVEHDLNIKYPLTRPCPRLCSTLIKSLSSVRTVSGEYQPLDHLAAMQRMINEYRYCRDQSDSIGFILQQTAEFRHAINNQRKN